MSRNLGPDIEYLSSEEIYCLYRQEVLGDSFRNRADARRDEHANDRVLVVRRVSEHRNNDADVRFMEESSTDLYPKSLARGERRCTLGPDSNSRSRMLDMSTLKRKYILRKHGHSNCCFLSLGAHYITKNKKPKEANT